MTRKSSIELRVLVPKEVFQMVTDEQREIQNKRIASGDGKKCTQGEALLSIMSQYAQLKERYVTR